MAYLEGVKNVVTKLVKICYVKIINAISCKNKIRKILFTKIEIG